MVGVAPREKRALNGPNGRKKIKRKKEKNKAGYTANTSCGRVGRGQN